jgi:hypothetical protein
MATGMPVAVASLDRRRSTGRGRVYHEERTVMNSSFPSQLNLVTILAASLTGCAVTDEPVPGDEPVGEVTAAFSANWNYSWGSASPSSADIGTATNRTCFLTGIAGEFEPFYSPFSAIPSVPASAGVRVNPNTGNWEIFVSPQHGALGVYARCVNVPSTEYWTSVTYGSGTNVLDLGPATATRRCFLESLTNNVYRDSNGVGWWGFTETGHWVSADNPYSGDHVRIVAKVAPDFTSHWYLTADTPPSQSWVQAYARCFDISEDDGPWLWIAGDPGTRQDPLTNVGGATCGLTGVGGRLTASDYNDGAYITATGSQFYLNTENGKAGWATCMK